MRASVKGAVAGLGATFPMTVAMSSLHKNLPVTDRSSLPPRQLVMSLLGKLGLKRKLNEEDKTSLTMLGHFAYGTLTGILIKVGDKKIPLVLRGLMLGLGVWAGSYLGLLPLIKANASAIQMTFKRNLLMAGSHLIWGLSVALIFRLLDHKLLLSGFSRPIVKRLIPNK